MRVTIVSRIYAPEPSAASFYLESVARALADSGHKVEVLTTRAPRRHPISDDSRVRVRRAPVLRNRQGYVRGYLQYMTFDVPLLFRMLFSKRPDIYLVEPPPTTGAVVRVIAKLLRRPYVYDAADVWSDAARAVTNSGVVLGVLRRIELFAVRGAAHAVTISSSVASRFAELGTKTQFDTVGFGVDHDTFVYQSRDNDQESMLFVYAGTFSEIQGASLFFEAFVRFSRSHSGFKLLFVGNGTDGDLLRRLANSSGICGVEVRETIPAHELAKILSQSRAALASLRPGSGYEYAFASKVYAPMAVGCPVIFAGPGPTAELLVAENGGPRRGVAIDYDVQRVTEAFEEFATHPFSVKDRRDLSEWTRKNYSMNSVARRVVDTLERVVSEA